MRPKTPSEPEIPDLEPAAPRQSVRPEVVAADTTDSAAGLEHSPSLPPDPSSWISEWAEYSGTEAPRSASTPPPRTSGFIRVQTARTETIRPARLPEVARLTPSRAEVNLGRALAPGLLLTLSSALLTLVDERTAGNPMVASDLRPPTWIAGVLCIAGLGLLVRGLWRFAEGSDA